ncbi:MAG TPA: hypothetical protein VJ853_14690 [Thermoanaerobaculia bacterium]|nr:hypothetical protein [Thermoanaerobaculia bacterium]
MTHKQFVRVVRNREDVWGVTSFYRATAVVFGRAGLAVIGVAMAAIVAAPLWFAIAHPTYALWSAGAIVSWLLARPNFGAGDVIARMIVAGIGYVVSTDKNLAAIGAALIFGCWLAGAILKFATMKTMEARLLRSAKAFNRLQAAGFLIFQKQVSELPPDA